MTPLQLAKPVPTVPAVSLASHSRPTIGAALRWLCRAVPYALPAILLAAFIVLIGLMGGTM